MIFIVFRASGADFAPEEFAAKFALGDCDTWLRGDTRRLGKPAHVTSGLCIALSDAENGENAVSVIQAFLERAEIWLIALNDLGIRCELDLGVTVGGDESFAPSLRFPPSLLGQLGYHQISLVYSAYPTSD